MKDKLNNVRITLGKKKDFIDNFQSTMLFNNNN